MAARKMKITARRNINKALSTRQRNRMSATSFAFVKKRKEPLNDVRHVRNAVARFDQVEGVTNTERDAAWKRIRAAARKFGVRIEVRGWRSLMTGGKGGRRTRRR